MKILLDECLPIDLRHRFSAHEVHSAEWAGLKGLKNGHLLRSAESAGYEVLLTSDQSIPHQQNLAVRRISVIVIRSRTDQLEDLLLVVEEILQTLATIEPGAITVVGQSKPDHSPA